MAIFRAVAEPTRVHPLQIWRTPFNTVENAAAKPRDGSYLAKVGNADLVRGVSTPCPLAPSPSARRDDVRRSRRGAHAHGRRSLLARSRRGRRSRVDAPSDEEDLRARPRRVRQGRGDREARARGAREGAGGAERARSSGSEPTISASSRTTSARSRRSGISAVSLISLEGLPRNGRPGARRCSRRSSSSTKRSARRASTFFLKEDAFKPLVDRLDVAVGKIEATTKATELAPFCRRARRRPRGPHASRGGHRFAQDRRRHGAHADPRGRQRCVFPPEPRSRRLAGEEEESSAERGSRGVRGAVPPLRPGGNGRRSPSRIRPRSATSSSRSCCSRSKSSKASSVSSTSSPVDLAGEARGGHRCRSGAKRQQLLDERHRRAQNLDDGGRSNPLWDGRTSGHVQDARRAQRLLRVRRDGHRSSPMSRRSSRRSAIGVRADEVASRVKSARQDALRAMRDKADLCRWRRERHQARRDIVSTSIRSRSSSCSFPRSGVMTLHITGTDLLRGDRGSRARRSEGPLGPDAPQRVAAMSTAASSSRPRCSSTRRRASRRLTIEKHRSRRARRNARRAPCARTRRIAARRRLRAWDPRRRCRGDRSASWSRLSERGPSSGLLPTRARCDRSGCSGSRAGREEGARRRARGAFGRLRLETWAACIGTSGRSPRDRSADRMRGPKAIGLSATRGEVSLGAARCSSCSSWRMTRCVSGRELRGRQP